MALLPSVHANAEALEKPWLVEAARPGVHRLMPLDVLIAWRRSVAATTVARS